MSSDSAQSSSMDVAGGLSLASSTGFMVAAALVVFILFILVFVLYLRAKQCYGANPVSPHGRAGLVFDIEPAAVLPPQRGLDAAAIAALSSMAFCPGVFKEGVECAVCLSELAEGEAARLLPKCGHAFHMECIDMWFYNHSTCPLCRSPVVPGKPATSDPGAESVELPTSALPDEARIGDSGSQEAASSSSCAGSSSSSRGKEEAALVIEIPRRGVDGFFQATPSRLTEEEGRSPTAAALRSLRRLLSRGSRMAAGASCSPRECDIEQGCLPVPKTRRAHD